MLKFRLLYSDSNKSNQWYSFIYKMTNSTTETVNETHTIVEFVKGRGGNVSILWNVHVHDDEDNGLPYYEARYRMTEYTEQMNHALGIPACINAVDTLKNVEIEFVTGVIICECQMKCPPIHILKVTWDGKNERVFTINKVGGKRGYPIWGLVERK
jgi:hypothetical protein